MIKTERFFLRPLTVDDVSQNYLSWLAPEVSNYIQYTKCNPSIESLEIYVKERENREDVLFLGIFTKEMEHIGNIKYEPVDRKNKCAIMGVLIGDPRWRGKGVAKEVIQESAYYLSRMLGVKTIKLGVDEGNRAALNAYKKIGFRVETKDENDIKMAWKL